MSRWRPALEPPPDLSDVVPAVLSPTDPWSGDEQLIAPADHARYRRYCPHKPPLSKTEHAARDLIFQAQYRAVLSGVVPWAALEEAAAALGIVAPLRLDRRPTPRSDGPLPETTLAEICEDYVPDIGVIAPDRVLGPFSEEPLPRWLRTLSGAVMAFSPQLRGGMMPLARAVIKKPRPKTALADAIRAAVRAPPMLWRVSGDRLHPALPLSERQQPTERCDGIPAGVSALIGRAVPRDDGSAWLVGVLPLPRCPDPAIIRRRLMAEVWRLRRHDLRVSWEDMLRERGEILYRTTCEWLWLHEPASVRALWDLPA